MSIFNYKKIRLKWHKELFKYHGIVRAFRKADGSERQLFMLQNFLASFSNKHSSNKYFIFGADYDDEFENCIREDIKTVMDSFISAGNPNDAYYEIIYDEPCIYVILH